MEHPIENRPEPTPSEHQFVPAALRPETQAWLSRMDLLRQAEEQEQRAVSQQRRKTFWKRASLAGVTALTAAAVGTSLLTGGSEQDSTNEAPHDLDMRGSLNMGELRQQLSPADIELARRNKSRESGTLVVPLSEYSVAPGRSNKDGVHFYGRTMASSMPEAFQNELDSVMAANATRLNYLADSGELSTVRFSMALDPQDLEGKEHGVMYFEPAREGENGETTPAELVYILPPDKDVSTQAVTVMTGHELQHDIQQPLGIIDQLPENADGNKAVESKYLWATDNEAYAADIAEIRSASIAAAEADPKVQEAAQHLIDVNKNAGGPVAAVQTQIANAILDHTFNALQPTSEKPSSLSDFQVDEGRLKTPVDYQYDDAGLSDEQLGATTPAQAAGMKQLSGAFEIAVSNSPQSPLAAFKESNYLGVSHAYGHPEANTGELAASSMNISKFFPNQLAGKLKQLPAKAKAASLRFLNRLSKDMASTIGTYNAQTDLGQEIQNNSDWIKREAM